jgi:CRP/FNR family transcriptional regulator, dissimilatory nitrate respiration regulator
MALDFLAILDRSTASKAIMFDARQPVFRQGQSVRWLYRITHGRLRLSRVLARGAEIVLARVSGGEILAEASVFAAHYHCDAFAESTSLLQRYPIRDIHDLLRCHPEAALAYSAHLATQIMDLRALIEIRAIRRSDDRLLTWLRFRSRGTQQSFDGHGIWPSVAKQIGLTGESTYRALARLQRTGKIKRSGGKVVLTESLSDSTQ